MNWWLICCFIIWGLFAFLAGAIMSNYDHNSEDDDDLHTYSA